MKKINLLFIALVGALTLSLTSCDECKDVVCENGGLCVAGVCDCPEDYYGDACEFKCVNGAFADGACSCDAGYEGDDCDTESRSKFFGEYQYTTTCASGQSYSSTISTVSDNVLRVNITNLTGFNDETAYGVVDGDKISIPAQDVTDEDGDTWTIESTTDGTYSDGQFTITVDFTINGQTSTCPLAYAK